MRKQTQDLYLIVLSLLVFACLITASELNFWALICVEMNNFMGTVHLKVFYQSEIMWEHTK